MNEFKFFLKMLKICFVLIFLFVAEIVPQDALPVQKKSEVTGFPNVMLYEGYITNSEGLALPDGVYDFQFSIYTEPTNGTPIWSEKHLSVNVKNGFIQLYLGKGSSPNPLNLPFDRQYYLGISFGNNPEMAPRLALVPSGYSFRAKIADNVANGSITTEKLAPNSVTNDKIKSVDWEKIKGAPFTIKTKGAAGDVWSLTGNSQTIPPIHFVGTTDEKDLVFKTNNMERVKITKDGTVKVKSKLYIEAVGSFGPPDESNHVAMFENIVDGDGIAIKVNNKIPNSSNNFLTLLSSDNNIVGRIEGQTSEELAKSVPFIWETTTQILDIALTIVEGVSAFTSVPPDAGEALGSVAHAVISAVQYAYWVYNQFDAIGSTFSSGSGDYAEWLERLNPKEEINAGDIVGVYGGKISKNVNNAQQVMVVSSGPIVLGNMPEKSKEHLFEKVAFMGQVPVKVWGLVREGDYIIPSGMGDGTGIAVSPEMMTPAEFVKTVGRAWGSSNSDGIHLVNLAIGLNSGDIASFVNKQMNEIIKTKSEINELKYELTKMKKVLLRLSQSQIFQKKLVNQINNN